MLGLPGSVAGWCPSAKSVMNQSAFEMPFDAVGARGAALGAVVLGPAVDRVEGRGVVHRHLVELGDRQVRHEAPGLREVEALVDPAVGADEQVVGVVLPERDRVVVGVLVLLLHPPEGLPPVVRDLHPHVHEVEPALRVGARVELLVVVGPGRPGDGLRALLPGRAAVGRAVDGALAAVHLDRGVEDVGVLRRDREADLAERPLGQALLQLLPRRARRRSSGGGPTPARHPCSAATVRWRCQVAA